MIAVLAAIEFGPQHIEPHESQQLSRHWLHLGANVSRGAGASSSRPMRSLWAGARAIFRLLGQLIAIGALTLSTFTVGASWWKALSTASEQPRPRGRRLPGPHLEVIK